MAEPDHKTDPRVVAATAHWSHRFLANGIHLADFQDVTGSIAGWDDWCAAWSAKGDVHYALAENSLSAGHTRSAGEHFTAAAVCNHFGKFLCVHDLPAMRAAHDKAIDARGRALPLLDPPGARVAIPYEGTTLFGILRKPNGIDTPPVVVWIPPRKRCTQMNKSSWTVAWRPWRLMVPVRVRRNMTCRFYRNTNARWQR